MPFPIPSSVVLSGKVALDPTDDRPDLVHYAARHRQHVRQIHQAAVARWLTDFGHDATDLVTTPHNARRHRERHGWYFTDSTCPVAVRTVWYAVQRPRRTEYRASTCVGRFLVTTPTEATLPLHTTIAAVHRTHGRDEFWDELAKMDVTPPSLYALVCRLLYAEVEGLTLTDVTSLRPLQRLADVRQGHCQHPARKILDTLAEEYRRVIVDNL